MTDTSIGLFSRKRVSKKTGKAKRKPRKREQKMQTVLSDYLNKEYPGKDFFCDVAAGLRVNIGLATLVARWRSSKSFPDLYVFEPRGDWHMLQLELKTEEGNPYKTDGLTLKKNEHTESQAAKHVSMRRKGYLAMFVIGDDHAKAVVDWYMSGAVGDCPTYLGVKKNIPTLDIFSS